MSLMYAQVSLVGGLSLACAAATRGWLAWRRWQAQQHRDRQAWREGIDQFTQQWQQRSQSPEPEQPIVAWQGFRRFVVRDKVREAEQIVSLYLSPEDGRPLPTFQPGQYLTVQVKPRGKGTPLVRCYSLSDRPREDVYRITVKDVGQASRMLVDEIQPHDILEAKAPRGDFYLSLHDTRPAVLIAAGIGITPVLSMLLTLLQRQPQRPVALFYGVRNRHDHAFASLLRDLARTHRSWQYVPCYSQPAPDDRLGYNYAAHQRINLELIRSFVPHSDHPFYLCGPGPFMEEIVGGLRGWGVAEQDIHFEAFGPATVRRGEPSTASEPVTPTARITFQRSKRSVVWNGTARSLLEQGETQGVPLLSGCRSGNCGQCAVKLLRGEVRYPQPPASEIPSGSCLTCVAQPAGDDLVLDA